MSESIVERKSALRKEMKEKLAKLDPAWCRKSSAALSIHLASALALHRSHALLAWLSHFPGEPSLENLIDSEISSGRRVFLPRVVGENLEFHQVSKEWRSEVLPGQFGVREPQGVGEASVADLKGDQIILVPGLAFDHQGNRLGRGKGFYDRVLGSMTRPGMISIGIGFGVQLIESVPHGKLDLPVSAVCTEISYQPCST
jgi:5-formyltetrahydrofolate cyclo-ligase